MALASGMQRGIAVIAEATYGTTPATPAFNYMRVLEGSGMSVQKQTDIIRQLSDHSNPFDLVELGYDTSGTYQLVPSYGGAFETLLAGAFKSTFSTNTMWNGRTQPSYTIEEKITGTAANYHRFTGVEIESIELVAQARSYLQASISTTGKDATMSTSIVTGATYTAATTGEAMTSLSVANLAMLGLATVPSVRSIRLNVSHAHTPITVVGNKYRVGTSMDQINATGTVETMFEDKSAYDLFLNHTQGALSFTVGATTLQKYKFTLPAVRFNEGTVSQTGNGPVLVTLGFTAVYDGTNGTVKVEKAVA